jgi:DNA replication protein DnaC
MMLRPCYPQRESPRSPCHRPVHAVGRTLSGHRSPTRAGLPAVKTLADFDFSFQPSVKREQIESLHEIGFLERRENVVLLGSPGVGKTHLAISLAVAAAQHGRRVYYGTLADLILSLEEAQAAGRLQQRIRVLTHPALLVVDEIGYIPISRTGAMHFFQLMTRRYETASTVLTSNEPFEEWGELFGDEVMAAALIDRLLHHCHIVNIRGNSYRMRQHTDLWKALHPDEASAPRSRARSRREAATLVCTRTSNQSCCACTPAGVSTRLRARTLGCP